MAGHKAKPLPSQDRLLQLFSYDEKTGLLWWKPQPGWTPNLVSKYRRVPAGHVTPARHVAVKVDGRYAKVHRVIWAMVYGFDPADLHIDHIDRNPSNNRIENLRLADSSGNSRNQKIRIDNTSGFRGVARIRDDRFRACIAVKGKNRHLGYFCTAEDAAAAYRNAAKELHGAFASF